MNAVTVAEDTDVSLSGLKTKRGPDGLTVQVVSVPTSTYTEQLCNSSNSAASDQFITSWSDHRNGPQDSSLQPLRKCSILECKTSILPFLWVFLDVSTLQLEHTLYATQFLWLQKIINKI